MKKILLSLGALAAVLVVTPMFAAFEAHVINVTAKIENALSVTTSAIDFGTVFPQEHLDKPLRIALSDSFIAEDRVDDVNYFIRQKPKCGVTNRDGTELFEPTWTGHVNPGVHPDYPNLPAGVTQFDPDGSLGDGGPNGDEYYVDCNTDEPDDLVLEEGEFANLLPSLCEYISKHPDGKDDRDAESANDEPLNSFHKPFVILAGIPPIIDWTDVEGRLAKSENDTVDDWTIDLAVPCFGGFCAQDWLKFVRDVSENQDLTQEQANAFTQPIGNQHKIFGCNLWIEVTEVSRMGTLIVNKVVVNGAATPDDFSFQVNGGAATPFEADGSNSVPVAPGTYDVTEVLPLPDGYIETGNTCVDVVVASGETETCTITNTLD